MTTPSGSSGKDIDHTLEFNIAQKRALEWSKTVDPIPSMEEIAAKTNEYYGEELAKTHMRMKLPTERALKKKKEEEEEEAKKKQKTAEPSPPPPPGSSNDEMDTSENTTVIPTAPVVPASTSNTAPAKSKSNERTI